MKVSSLLLCQELSDIHFFELFIFSLSDMKTETAITAI